MRRQIIPILMLCLLTAAFSVRADSGAVSQRLLRLEQAWREHQANGGQTPFRSPVADAHLWRGRVLVTVTGEGPAARLAEQLRSLGMDRVAAFGNAVSGWMPIDRLHLLDRLGTVSQARAALPRTHAATPLFGDGGNRVISQADAALRAVNARKRYGVDGRSITIGVLSDSFDCLGQAEDDTAAGELPAQVTVLKDLSNDPDENGITECDALNGQDEGRAMMQLIHDLAPGASLMFYTAFGGEADFASGIVALAAAGADVIVDDVGYASEPMFQDGIIAQAVDQVKAMGVAYFSSAGNEGRLGYGGAFNPGRAGLTGETAHDFHPDPAIDDFYQAIEIPENAQVTIILQWNQPFRTGDRGGAVSDLDLILFDETLSRVVASSEEDNLGRDPIEALVFVNDTGGTRFNLYIPHRAGPVPERIQYVIWGTPPQWPVERGPIPRGCTLGDGSGAIGAGQPQDPEAEAVRLLEYGDGPGNATIVGHANADGAMAVGAISYRETPFFGICSSLGRIEPFSSAGGVPVYFDANSNPLENAPVIRQKPDLVAVDETNTTFFPSGDNSDTDNDGRPNFFGTSAAAPHAAAVAALLLDYNPNLSVDELYHAMRLSALDLDDPATEGFDRGFDYGTGYGLLDAAGAFTALEQDGLYLTLGPVPLEAMAGEELRYLLTVVNFSPTPARDVAIRGQIPPATAVTGLEGCPRVDLALSACVIGDLAPGGRHQLELRLTITDGTVAAVEPQFELLSGGLPLADGSGSLIRPTTRIARPPGDFNHDGCIDRSDRAILLAVLRGTLTDADLNAGFDLTGDGRVDMDDLRELVRLYSRPEGVSCS
ncbi:large repetitive protein [Methylomarinovum caldicuralii]|uniref:Large repetitive protein n=1 Tax=Methylomarinovum caldicuralii TaxID=438856 RepID=A0AAU9CDP8_9GAMM|nr:S8 family serine peptidase [Methylomarinovum caldicuralii]BCX82759.1 large repetitive protein [Methylomarinovum caldicuralii]